MRAITCDGAGGPEVLRLEEVPDPRPAAGEVLVRVHATAVNRADLMQREGRYPPPAGASSILGLECAGEVLEVPADTDTTLRTGDRVMCLLSGGGYAERVAVPAGQVMPVPDALTLVQAAAIPEVFLTAWLVLVMLGDARPGDVALVHSIASGVGTAAAQICAGLGVRCIGTSRDAQRADAGRRWGAEGLAVPDGAFADEVMRRTDGHGADVIADLVGARYLAENVASLARFGRIVLTGLVGGRSGELDLGTLLARQGRIIGSTLRGRTVAEKSAVVASFTEWALPRFAHGTLTPVIDTTMPLSEATQAHRLLAAGDVVGKVVLAVS